MIRPWSPGDQDSRGLEAAGNALLVDCCRPPIGAEPARLIGLDRESKTQEGWNVILGCKFEGQHHLRHPMITMPLRIPVIPLGLLFVRPAPWFIGCAPVMLDMQSRGNRGVRCSRLAGLGIHRCWLIPSSVQVFL